MAKQTQNILNQDKTRQTPTKQEHSGDFPLADMDQAGREAKERQIEKQALAEKLWQAYQKDPSTENRNDLLMHYVDLVKRVVNRLLASSNPYHDYDDLISCGVIGLMDAIDRFKPDRGARFESYAQIRIKGEIIDYMRRQDWLPVHMRTKLRQMQAAYDALSQKLGREPEDIEVADHMQIDLETLQQMQGEAHLANIIYFDDLVGEGGTRREPEAEGARIEQAYEDEEVKKLLVQELKNLKEREQMVLSLYYMDELTLKEIGLVLGLTESRISQIHSKALMRLKTRLQQLI